MKIRPRTLLPLLALAFSLALLIPYASQLGTSLHFTIAPLSSAQPAPPAPGSAEELRYAQVAALNLPALLFDLPVALIAADHTSWTPDGMDFRVWRALSYPLVGMFFWWLIGRGLESLRDRTSRLRVVETVFAAMLVIAGIAFLAGMFTVTTVEDRADLNLHWIAIGVGLWLTLECIPLSAGIRQMVHNRKLKASNTKRTHKPIIG